MLAEAKKAARRCSTPLSMFSRRADRGHPRGAEVTDELIRPPSARRPSPSDRPGDDGLRLQEQGRPAPPRRRRVATCPTPPTSPTKPSISTRTRPRSALTTDADKPLVVLAFKLEDGPVRAAHLPAHLPGHARQGQRDDQHPHRQGAQVRPPGAHARRRDARTSRTPARATSSPSSASTATRATPSPTVR